MKRLIPLVALVLACDVVDRAQSDYLMWDQEGTTWSFLVVEGTFPGDTFYLRRVGTQDTSFAPETADVCLDWEGKREYFANRGDVIDAFVDFPVFPGGQVVPLEQRLEPFMHYPPVLGDSWQDTVRGKAVYGNDTFDYTLCVDGSVDSLISLDLPVGTVENVYRLRVDQIGQCDSLHWVKRRVFYLGPNLGIVKAVVADSLSVADSTWCEDYLVLELMDLSLP